MCLTNRLRQAHRKPIPVQTQGQKRRQGTPAQPLESLDGGGPIWSRSGRRRTRKPRAIVPLAPWSIHSPLRDITCIVVHSLRLRPRAASSLPTLQQSQVLVDRSSSLSLHCHSSDALRLRLACPKPTPPWFADRAQRYNATSPTLTSLPLLTTHYRANGSLLKAIGQSGRRRTLRSTKSAYGLTVASTSAITVCATSFPEKTK